MAPPSDPSSFDFFKLFLAILPAFLGVLISAGFSFYLFRRSRQNALTDTLVKQLDDILKITLTYPYLDNASFCDSWDRDKIFSNSISDDVLLEKYLRYSVYCNLLFNYLSLLADFCDYDLECIQKNHVNMRAWVRQHRKNWANPLNDPNENIDSYDPRFVALINQCLGKQ
jgi:hypothetical protein